jgi:hypothetical protein
VKKLAIVIFLVVAGCRRQVNVTTSTTPTTTPPASPEILSSGSGAATPREAVQKFMAAGKAQDLQAMADIWGSKAGPARSTMPKEELEKRVIYLLRCLRHDSFSILSETPVAGGDRQYEVQVRRGTLSPSSSFVATPGPKDRWYVREFQPEPLNSICVSK